MFRTLIYPSSVVLQPAKRTLPNTSRNKSSNTQRTEKKTTDVVIHQHSRKLLMMDILTSETCWAHNKWNKIPSDNKLVFHSSTIALPSLHSRSTETLLYCATVAENDNKTASLTTTPPNVSSKTLNGNAVTVKYYPASLKRLSGRPGYSKINKSKWMKRTCLKKLTENFSRIFWKEQASWNI